MTRQRPDAPIIQATDGRALSVVDVVARGGEGTVWTTNRPGLLAKLYHVPTPAYGAKLRALIQARTNLPTLPPEAEAPPVAWPLDVVTGTDGAVIGFLMPRAHSPLTLHRLTVPRLRKRLAPDMGWYHLLGAAASLARSVALVHQTGAVVGDLRADNVVVHTTPGSALVQATASVTLIDADSFQIAGHRCPVGSEGTTPPELIGQDFARVDRLPSHDHFGLAVLIYHLLIGVHPFAATSAETSSNDPPSIDDMVLRGLWSHGHRARAAGLAPPLVAPPLEALPEPLPTLFAACFENGHTDPHARPDAATWAAALATAQADMEPCGMREGHYHRGGGPCPWCALAARGADLFPAPPGGVAHPRLTHKRLLRAWATGARAEAARLWRRHPDLADDDRLPPNVAREVAADADVLPVVERLRAALDRPGTPSAMIAALWGEIAEAPLLADPALGAAELAAQAAPAAARAECLQALTRAQASGDGAALAEAATRASVLFPWSHWELRPWHPVLKAVATQPLVVVTGPDGVGTGPFVEAVRAIFPDVTFLAMEGTATLAPEAVGLVTRSHALVLLAGTGAVADAVICALDQLAEAAPRFIAVAVGVAAPPPGMHFAIDAPGSPGHAPQSPADVIRHVLANGPHLG